MLCVTTIHLGFILVLLLLTIPNTVTAAVNGSTTQECKLYTASTTCEHYYLISHLRFHAFIDANSFDTTCSQMQEVMSCVDKLLVGCNDNTRIPYTMQKSVLNTVCNERKREYLGSARCFSKTVLREQRIYKCLSKMADERRLRIEPCSLIQDTMSCSSQAVRMTDGCDVKDAQLMAGLVFDFLSVLCETWKEGHTTTDSRRTPTTLTTRDPTLVAEKPAKRAETDRPQKGGSSSRADTPLEETDLANADNTLKESDHSRAEKPLKESDSSRADKPLIITDSAESKPSQKNKNSSPSRYRALADTCVLWCLPVLLSLSHLFKARDKSFT